MKIIALIVINNNYILVDFFKIYSLLSLLLNILFYICKTGITDIYR